MSGTIFKMFRIKELCSFIRKNVSILKIFYLLKITGIFMTTHCALIDICAADDVEIGQALKVDAAGLSLAVFNEEDNFW